MLVKCSHSSIRKKETKVSYCEIVFIFSFFYFQDCQSILYYSTCKAYKSAFWNNFKKHAKLGCRTEPKYTLNVAKQQNQRSLHYSLWKAGQFCSRTDCLTAYRSFFYFFWCYVSRRLQNRKILKMWLHQIFLSAGLICYMSNFQMQSRKCCSRLSVQWDLVSPAVDILWLLENKLSSRTAYLFLKGSYRD